MTHIDAHADLARPLLPDDMIIRSVRCWRAARDARRPVQPALHALLAPSGYGMLAPVFDSLIGLCEYRFSRSLCAGCPLAASADERMLCRLLSDPAALENMGPCRAGDADGMERAFGCALASARIMLKYGASAP